MSGECEQDVLLVHATGLHARPAVAFTKLAKTFRSDIAFSADAGNIWIDAKSIVKVMGAKVASGTRMIIKASGDDAEQAVHALTALVESNFETQEHESREST